MASTPSPNDKYFDGATTSRGTGIQRGVSKSSPLRSNSPRLPPRTLEYKEAAMIPCFKVRNMLISIQEQVADAMININDTFKHYEGYTPAPCGINHRAAGVILFRFTLEGAMQLMITKENDKVVLPGGKIEGRELPLEALAREFQQETGLSFTPDLLFSQFQRSIQYNKGKYTLYLIQYDPKLVTGTAKDDVKWVTYEEALTLVDKFPRDLLEVPAVKDFFKPAITTEPISPISEIHGI